MEEMRRELPAAFKGATDGLAAAFHVQTRSGRQGGVAGFPAIWFPAVGADVLNELLDVVVRQLLGAPSRFLTPLDVVEGSALAFFWLPEDPVACGTADVEFTEYVCFVLVVVAIKKRRSNSGLLGCV